MVFTISNEQIVAMGNILNDKTKPLNERFRALFTLKNIKEAKSVEQIIKCFDDPSSLLKHELAYVLGQMQLDEAIPKLIEVLKDTKQEAMVRHEAGEALGAIGNSSVIPVLEEYSKDPVVEVAETCQIALNKINYSKTGNDEQYLNDNYQTVDPAPPSGLKDINELTRILLDENETLFNRYRAMFNLRNIKSNDSALALSKGLKASSALFRHEIAFVLGQLKEEITASALEENLADPNENEMVRHECAEALGAIASPYCWEVLKKYVKDEARVVRESCLVALDICEHENNGEFQYANGLSQIISS
ncbi:hypothetical protein TKK_0017301 [Trichogramma kaykai]|uniref:Deoxyhypusine hydroxylase n=1 Tax=Trichogramma kaykai TaxID=54128 RepID=A0ABD2W2K9_9HYME